MTGITSLDYYSNDFFYLYKPAKTARLSNKMWLYYMGLKVGLPQRDN
jgi:hypothetical protein